MDICMAVPQKTKNRTTIRSDQIRSVTQLCPTLCDPMNRSTPGFPVHHQLPEFTQTHIHRVSDVIQPSHPLSSHFPPAPIPPSIIVFSNESTLCMRRPTYQRWWCLNWVFKLNRFRQSEERDSTEDMIIIHLHSNYLVHLPFTIRDTELIQNPTEFNLKFF